MKIHRSLFSIFSMCMLLSACARMAPKASSTASPTSSVLATETKPAGSCPVTQPDWVLPPDDPAVSDPPAYGYYYVNADRSIWASAWWSENKAFPLRAGGEGNKMGWFRPAGADLEIVGQRLDAEAPPLEAHASCCYPTRFQASGVYFPTEGCWEVTARAAGSLITFVVKVEP